MASETRKIENYGILKLSPLDRGSQNLLIIADVIQLPYSEYVNTKSNPFKGHYGYCCFMYGEYVHTILDIQFRRQVLLDRTAYVVQLAHQEFHNSKEIIQQLADITFDTLVDYPIWNCDELRFKLEPGVILQVFKSSIPMVVSQPDGIKQSNLTPPGPGVAPPLPPPPPGTPEEEKIKLADPYEGEDDNGNTYVRPEPPPPPPVGQGDCDKIYAVTYSFKPAYEGFGEQSQINGSTNAYGKVLGIFAVGNGIVLRSDRSACGAGIVEASLGVGPSAVTISNVSFSVGAVVG